jgi:flagellar biosynthesis protein FlhG
VGKTSFTLNLACILSDLRYKVCLIDADLGLANVDVILGLQPEYTLEHVLFKGASLDEVLLRYEERLDILPGSSGIPSLANLDHSQQNKLISTFRELGDYDYVLIDNSPGITPTVLSLCLSAKELVVVITPEATSITDGYALLKSLKQNGLAFPPFLVINKARSPDEAQKISDRLKSTCRKHLQTALLFLGTVPFDSAFQDELDRRMPFVRIHESRKSSRSLQQIGSRLANRPRQKLFQNSLSEFWQKALVQSRQRAEPEVAANAPGQAASQHLPPRRRLEDLATEIAAIEQEITDEDRVPTALIDDLLTRLHSVREKLARSQAGPSQAASPLQDAPGRIGILSANEDMAQLIEEILSSREFEALDLRSRIQDIHEVDLVIYYPGESLDPETLLHHEPPRSVPALLLTDFRLPSGASSRLSWLNIQKTVKVPFNIEDLVQAVHEVLHASSCGPLACSSRM